MIFKFVKAMFLLKWAKLRGYRTVATFGEQTERFDICLGCPAFDDGECSRCGCLLQAKIMLTTEQCPDKRWLRIWKKRATTK